MAKDMTAATKTASQAALITPVIFAKLEYDSGTIYSHTGIGTITWDSQNWLGLGNLGGISEVQETSDLQANGIILTLSGVDSSNISQALGESYQGRTATLYLGFLTEDEALIADPMIMFRGRMDAQNIRIGNENTISLSVEDRLADWDRVRSRRYNNDDQQSRYSGDRGLEFVEQTVNKEIVWGE